MSYPLEGVRVLDLTHVLAGPFCTRALCDLGAEVIKVETPKGELSRRLGARRGGMSGYYMQQNCGKLNVSIDWSTGRGVELVSKLAEQCDVLVENFRPGVLDRLGLGYESLSAVNARLIYCSISGFGHDSPLRDKRAFASVAHASTGMLHRQAVVDGREPVDSVLAVGDTVSGLQAVVAVLAALRHRDATGRGQFVDIAMHDALLAMQEAANFHYFSDDTTAEDFLSGWVYRCGEQHIVIPTDPRASWDQFTSLMGLEPPSPDHPYATFEGRSERLDELEAIIQGWVADQGSADAAVEALHEASMPGARILSLDEALESEQVRARNMAPECDDRSGGRVRVLNSPYRFSEAEAGVRGVPAFRGEDNHRVLGDLLGLPSSELEALEADGVISSRVPSSDQ
jgi:CoA:oxalate CoA-transferase